MQDSLVERGSTLPSTPPTPNAKPSAASRVPKSAAIVLALMAVGGLAFNQWSHGWITPAVARADGPIVRAAARVGGLIAEVRVDEGQAVQAGDVVARLDGDDAEAALLLAEAEVAGAKAKLAASRADVVVQGAETSLKGAQAEAEAAEARANLESAEAAVGYAEPELQRAEQLAAQGYVSQQDVSKARLALQAARAGVVAARARVRGASGLRFQAHASAVEETAKVSGIAAAEAELKRAEAHVTIARLRLSELELRAPLGGRVVRRLVEPGETVAAGQTVVQIVDPARLWVDAQVDEALSPRLTVGERAVVRFDALPGKQFEGRVSFVSGATGDLAEPGTARPAAEPALGPARVPVRITLDAPDPAIRPGMSAYVRIDAGK